MERLRRTRDYYDASIDRRTESLTTDEHLHATQRLVVYLSTRWNIDQAIVLVNFNRLFTVIQQLTLHSFVQARATFHKFSIEDWFLVLEFYLHMDGTSSYSIALAETQTTSF